MQLGDILGNSRGVDGLWTLLEHILTTVRVQTKNRAQTGFMTQGPDELCFQYGFCSRLNSGPWAPVEVWTLVKRFKRLDSGPAFEPKQVPVREFGRFHPGFDNDS